MIPFVGLGPGRCGTMSLAQIVNGCRHTWAIHEDYPVANADLEGWWEKCESVMWRMEEPVFHMKTYELNDDDRIRDLFRFLEIPTNNWRFIKERQWNHRREAA